MRSTRPELLISPEGSAQEPPLADGSRAAPREADSDSFAYTQADVLRYRLESPVSTLVELNFLVKHSYQQLGIVYGGVDYSFYHKSVAHVPLKARICYLFLVMSFLPFASYGFVRLVYSFVNTVSLVKPFNKQYTGEMNNSEKIIQLLQQTYTSGNGGLSSQLLGLSSEGNLYSWHIHKGWIPKKPIEKTITYPEPE